MHRLKLKNPFSLAGLPKNLRRHLWFGYATIAVIGIAVLSATLHFWNGQLVRAKRDYHRDCLSRAEFSVAMINGTLETLYQDLRTLSLIPGLRTTDGRIGSFSPEGLRMARLMYHELAATVDLRDVEILPPDFAENEDVKPLASLGPEGSRPRGEALYREMRRQLRVLRDNPQSGPDPRLTSGPEIVFSTPAGPVSGLVFTFPVYTPAGKLAGAVAAAVPSRVLATNLPTSGYALVNTATGYMVGDLSSPRSLRWIKAGLPDPALVVSQVFRLGDEAHHGSWLLWIGPPDAEFFSTGELPALQGSAQISFLAVALMTFAGLALWAVVSKNIRSASHAARHETLSGLANRRALIEHLESNLRPTQRPALAVLYIDLDRFKYVNDTYGHQVGDQLVAAIARGLKAIVGGQGFLARIGGDEFAVVIVGGEVKETAERIGRETIAFVSRPFDMEGRVLRVGASVGVGIVPPHLDLDATEIMRRADIAMYKVKERGRGGICFFDPSMDESAAEDRAVAEALSAILRHDALEVAYQPIVDATSSRIIGVEALARWPSSYPGAVATERFIAAAERYGLIDMLGDCVLRKAAKEAAAWPGLRLSVNVSPLQLNRDDFVEDVVATAQAAHLDLGRLELELTEGCLIADLKRAHQLIERLRAEGICVALDDFGAGFSSIGSLKQLPFDRIKIDRSLTSALLDIGGGGQMILQGAVLLARGLSLRVTAEGVEQAEQAAILRLVGCNELQGYYFGAPQSAAEISAALARDAGETLPEARSA